MTEAEQKAREWWAANSLSYIAKCDLIDALAAYGSQEYERGRNENVLTTQGNITAVVGKEVMPNDGLAKSDIPRSEPAGAASAQTRAWEIAYPWVEDGTQAKELAAEIIAEYDRGLRDGREKAATVVETKPWLLSTPVTLAAAIRQKETK